MILAAILAAIAINLIGAVIVIKRLDYVLKQKEWVDFVGKFYGMLAIKFIIFVIIIVTVIKFSGFDQAVFALSFVVSYFLALIIEILYINKRYSVIKFK